MDRKQDVADRKKKVEDRKQKAEDRKRKVEDKKQELERKRQLKRAADTAVKKLKPGECLKSINVVISPKLLQSSCGSAVLDVLKQNDVKYEIQAQARDDIITVWRETSGFDEQRGEVMTSEQVEDDVLLFMDIETFVTFVDSYLVQKQGGIKLETLTEFVRQAQLSLEDRKITVVVQGLDAYLKTQDLQEKRRFKAKVTDRQVKKAGKFAGSPQVTRLNVEEALVQLQLDTNCCVRFVDSDEDAAKFVFYFIKSVAETPFKRDRQASGFSFHMETKGAVTIQKDGQGVMDCWRQQLMCFRNVSAEVANTIVAVYNSPLKLLKAYNECHSTKEKELLLQNLEVRRGAGVMSTSRRVGKELSRRVYLLMTSTDPHVVIA